METMSSIAQAVKLGLIDARERWHRIALGRLYTPARGNLDLDLHLREAASWLCRAQDSGADRGVSYGTPFGKDFLPSYPETTGYIIPTFLALAGALGDASYEQRALDAGHWESDVQMPSGAVMAGRLNESPQPAVFNTGQVMLGWGALLERFQTARFRDSAARAGEWLLSNQDPDGAWRRDNSPLVKGDATVYNVKAAWGLALCGKALGRPDFIDAAVLNARFAVSFQKPNGWFRDCCLSDPERPLLHTLAYTVQGLLGVGRVSGRDEFLVAARRSADAFISVAAPDGFIPGRIDESLHGTVAWCCLTGSAQMASAWGELYQITGETRYRDAIVRVTDYLMARHDVASRDLRIRGGVSGSWPVWGDYGKYMVLNWATKFFVDALLGRRAHDA